MDVASLADELIATGLAKQDCYSHLTLNPALWRRISAQAG